jgi:hypothetical protein
MAYYERTEAELEELLKEADEDFPRHYRKINEVTIDMTLKPEDATFK